MSISIYSNVYVKGCLGNCLPSNITPDWVRVWVKVSVGIWVGGQFSSGSLSENHVKVSGITLLFIASICCYKKTRAIDLSEKRHKK